MSTEGNTPRWRRYLRFIRPDPVSDVDDELTFHLAMRAERNVSLGMSADDARRDAERRFGDVSRWRDELLNHDQRKQVSTERRAIMADFLQDVRYALRSLKGAPGMTLAVVLTLALGLGVNMAMFSFLDVVFLRPPAGVKESQEIRRIWTEINFYRSGAQYWSGFSYPQYAAVRDALGREAATTLYGVPRDTWFRVGDSEVQASVSLTDASYFRLLGIQPFMGRFFTPDEDRLGAGIRVAVVSHGFWRRQLGSDPEVIGRQVQINSQPYTVIGIAAEDFSGLELDRTDVWIPLATQGTFRGMPWWQRHEINGFQILLRPRGGFVVSEESLAQRIAIGLRTPEAIRGPNDTVSAIALGSVVRERGPGKKDQEVKIATRLAGVTIIVLVIACANVVNLLLARAVRRRREIAVRLAMGVSRSRLTRLLLTESVVLALLSAFAAVFAAHVGGEALRALLMPDVTFADAASAAHWRVIVAALALAMGAGLIAGLLPVAQSLKTQVTGALKAGTRTSDQDHRSRARDVLVAAQAALSIVLLVGAALFISSLNNVRGVRTGFDTARLVYAGVQFDTPDSVRSAAFPQRLREFAERTRSMPGVEQVALTRMTPTKGFSSMAHHPDVDTLTFKKPPWPKFAPVSPEFFEATGMRIVRGSDFPRNLGPAMPPVVVVNEAFAKAQWPGMEAVGRCLRFPPEQTCYRVIGIVETAMFDEVVEDPEPQYYLPIDNLPQEADKWFGTMVVRAQSGMREAVEAGLRRQLRDAFPAGRPAITTMEEVMEPHYRPWRLGATLFTLFGSLALVVAALGIYSTIAYTVAQRTHEFGVRTALGAQTRDILRHVVGSSVRVVTIGVILGMALTLAAGRFIAAFLYGISPSDPKAMATVAVLLLAIAILAALAPAWRAARVNPVVALKAD